MAVKRVGLIVARTLPTAYQIRKPGMTEADFNAAVVKAQQQFERRLSDEFEKGAAILNDLLNEGYTVLATTLVSLSDATFVHVVVYKPDGGLPI